MLGHLGNMHGKDPMSDRYFKLELWLKMEGRLICEVEGNV